MTLISFLWSCGLYEFKTLQRTSWKVSSFWITFSDLASDFFPDIFSVSYFFKVNLFFSHFSSNFFLLNLMLFPLLGFSFFSVVNLQELRRMLLLLQEIFVSSRVFFISWVSTLLLLEAKWLWKSLPLLSFWQLLCLSIKFPTYDLIILGSLILGPFSSPTTIFSLGFLYCL